MQQQNQLIKSVCHEICLSRKHDVEDERDSRKRSETTE